jgi:hypothetical protein
MEWPELDSKMATMLWHLRKKLRVDTISTTQTSYERLKEIAHSVGIEHVSVYDDFNSYRFCDYSNLEKLYYTNHMNQLLNIFQSAPFSYIKYIDHIGEDFFRAMQNLGAIISRETPFFSGWNKFHYARSMFQIRILEKMLGFDNLPLVCKRCSAFFPHATIAHYDNANNTIHLLRNPQTLELDAQNRLHSSKGPALQFCSLISRNWKGFLYDMNFCDKDWVRMVTNLQHPVAHIRSSFSNLQGFQIALEVICATYDGDIDMFVRNFPPNGIKCFGKGHEEVKVYRYFFESWRGGDSNVYFMHVKNSTLEPDGSRKEFLIGTDQYSFRRPDRAVARSFGFEYRPFEQKVAS